VPGRSHRRYYSRSCTNIFANCLIYFLDVWRYLVISAFTGYMLKQMLACSRKCREHCLHIGDEETNSVHQSSLEVWGGLIYKFVVKNFLDLHIYRRKKEIQPHRCQDLSQPGYARLPNKIPLQFVELRAIFLRSIESFLFWSRALRSGSARLPNKIPLQFVELSS
jgi:hypothetical protein